MMYWMRSCWLAVLCLSMVAGVLAASPDDKHGTGFFLVVAQAESAAGLPAPVPGQRVVLYDYKLLREEERDAPRYLLVSDSADVPIALDRAPELKKKGSNGFPELRLALTAASAARFESVSRAHMGSLVVLMVDGEPVTMHKIKAVITGGTFQLTRCTDTACEILYSRLVDKR